MPLPSLLRGAKQCQVITKRSKQRCKNPAAYGCRSCRMHGAHKSRNVLRGAAHPHYKNGKETLEAKSERSEKSVALRYLTDLGNQYDLFNKKIKSRGRPPNGYTKLDLADKENLAIIIKKISCIDKT